MCGELGLFQTQNLRLINLLWVLSSNTKLEIAKAFIDVDNRVAAMAASGEADLEQWQQHGPIIIGSTPPALQQTWSPVISFPVLDPVVPKQDEGAAVEHGQRHHD